jgi:DNA-binding beta-propeller fold protein YncE
LNVPEGLAFDRAGNLYVANGGNGTIEKFTPAGIRSVFASSGLNAPHGLAFDREGNLYVARLAVV